MSILTPDLPPPLTAEQTAAALRTITRHVPDPAERRVVLAALGLREEG